jgi:hypothetical protein
MRGLRTAIVLGCAGWALAAAGQTLRFNTAGGPQPPEGANLRFGSFYSDIAFEQSVGYRYTRFNGAGVDYLLGSELGRVRKEGSELPMVSRLSFRNYLIIGKYTDLDVSFDLRYSYFPLSTEDNEFALEFAGPGLQAQMGAFSFGMTKAGWLGTYNGRGATAYVGSEGYGYAFAANLSSGFQLTPFVRGKVYDNPSYRVDYVDERGFSDSTSGQRYPVIQNILGLDLDWLMARDKNLSLLTSWTATWPQEDLFSAQESDVYRVSLVYQQQLSPVAAGGARADYTWRNYRRQRGLQAQQDYSAFISFDATENTTVALSGGYSMAELTQAGAYEQNGSSDSAIGSIDVSTKVTDRMSHSIGLSRRQRGGFQVGLEVVDALNYSLLWTSDLWSLGFLSSYQIADTRLSQATDYRDWLNQLTVTRALSEDLTLMLATAYTMRYNDAPRAGDLGADAPMLANDYDTWATNIGLTYLLTAHLTAYAYGEHLERYSDAAALEFDRDSAGVTLVYRNDF